MTWAEISPYVLAAGPVSAVTFILGFFTSRFTMTRKESEDIKQKKFENTKDLMEKQHDRFIEFSGVLKKYVSKSGEPNLDDFFEISTSGERYFYQQRITSDAILSGSVDTEVRDSTFVPKIKETVEKSLPVFYETLKKISRKKGFEYSGYLQRKNYESLYLVLEKFADR